MKWPLSKLYKYRRGGGYTSSERLKPPTFSSRRRLLVGYIFQHT